MGTEESSAEQAKDLLRKVLRDPFPDPNATHVLSWFDFCRRYPLWALQASAYLAW